MGQLLTQKEAASLLRVSVKTLQILRRTGKLPFVKFGFHCIRFKQEDIERFVRERTA